MGALVSPLAVAAVAWMGAASTPELDAAAVREHLDGVVARAMRESGVPGVVVAVVQRDRIVLQAGWGIADVATGRPMDEHTVVRIASLSKTFTASAVAKLQAEGRLDVDRPAQEYLARVRIPERFDAPVTVRRLLSHTAGFINHNPGRVSTEPFTDDLAASLAATMPPQLLPPGRGVLYTNHGNALAGLVVEEVAGVAFTDYVQAELLEPLGMDRTGYVAIDPGALAKSYVIDDGELVEHEYLYFRTVPASSVLSTAHDMASYMIMHLGDGTFDGRVVLPPAAMDLLRTPVPALHPALPTYHFAFAFGQTAGHATRSHGGSIPAFLSRIVLFDEHDVGIFVAQNAFGDGLAEPIIESLARAFLPVPAIEPIVPEAGGRPPDPDALVGAYSKLGNADTAAFTRPRALLFDPATHVRTDDEGFLEIDGDRFLHTGQLVFARARDDKAPEVAVFVRDADGTQWLHRGLASAHARPWHASPWLHLPAWALCLFALAIASRPSRAARSSGALAMVWAARLALVGVLAPHLYVLWVDRGQPPYLQPLRFGIPWWIAIARGLPWVAALVAVTRCALALRRPRSAEHRVAWIVASAILGVLALDLYFVTPPAGLLDP